MTRPQNALSHLMPHWQVPPMLEFEFLPGGYGNQNYKFSLDGKSYVLRLPSRVGPFVDRNTERAFYLGEHEVDTATLIALDVDTGAMITEWIQGTLLIDDPPTTAKLLSYLEALHRGLPEVDRSYDPIAIAEVYLSHGRPLPQAKRLTNTLEWPLGNVTTCHNDLNPWNVICSKRGTWFTLDWELLGANDPLFDLVAIHQGLGRDDAELPDLSERFVYDGSGDRLSGCLTAFWLREYSWAFAQWMQGNRRREIEEQIEVAGSKLLQFE